ncbi:MAG TPA: branched chain amino acid aminotransferase, partial [Chitinophagales bacterium]|nr:branched chain amino acid aminotransferase [Chitinophagales bacterium]
MTNLKTIVNPTTQSRLKEVDFESLPFGKIFSDHMFVIDYADGKWQQGYIMPYGDMPLSPATSALHY